MQNPLLAKATVRDLSGPTPKDSFQAIEPAKAVRPGKVPFEKGFSQMDWIRMSRASKDLSGTNGRIRSDITPEEVLQHNTAEDGWTVINGKVYNLSPYLNYHPGGAKILNTALGKDCTKLFTKYHAWVNYEMLLEKCFVGTLVLENPTQ
jgi:cytochrome-b5 reductase